MALISCPECKKQISDTAANCPKCGYQLSPEKITKIQDNALKDQKKPARLSYCRSCNPCYLHYWCLLISSFKGFFR